MIAMKLSLSMISSLQKLTVNSHSFSITIDKANTGQIKHLQNFTCNG